ncbi:P-loop containing nucleoside triphosphate hydrolase protein [Fusarium oxysporum Fo47]|uniref:P-loop containing nucleoside triphosphate hydrolase protein n=1 Tax=Fusarium oxysporum Fo47 TaxID=660027 RepID=UPI002869A25F|nr:P-loop containing nucleoside triphosphate hydrolase protein [Fusarium oxysporum Fo47]QKD50818.2 P-loop containing nucleoside triphosphate hydrolase protein [Fusarium oxysporum Fo47]
MGSPWFTRSDEHNPKNQDHQNNSGNPVEVGMAAETKDIYRKSSWDPWQEWTEEEIGVDGRSSQASAKYALIVRREKEHGEIDESVLSLHSITVQSPLLKKILGPVFKGYKGIKPNLKKLEFHAPFREFFYRWDEFTQADPRNDSADSSEECSHYKLLADIIRAEIKPRIEQASDLLNNGVISFDYVWTLFEPDIEVYTTVEGRDRLFRLSSSNYSKAPDGTVAYVLCARFIDTDGDIFGYTETTLNILPFENVKPILELEVIPARLCPHLDEVKDRLVQRGRVFESLKGIHHRTYSGMYSLSSTASGIPKQRHVTHRSLPAKPCATIVSRNGSQNSSWLKALTKGKFLTTNLGLFDIELIKDVLWSSTAFDQLVLPHDYKRIIQAFVGAQMSGLDNFDDVIKGKGRGIIMLLSGEPGTGKTLTAESVSEIMQKPLYNMSAAELGDVAQEVEQKLDCALELSTRWGAVLLLDECDVFLQRRTTSDIKRNKLVSIFLRLLEYFEGVMFLTTNRVSAFDPAFESRIHLTIHYPNLDYTSRLHIWRTFVNIGTDWNSLSEDELDELAGVELNGRQIKNVVKTARLLATHERTQLAMGHISTVLRIKKGLAGGS